MKHLSRKTIGTNTRFSLFFDEILTDDHFHIPEYLVVAPKAFNAEGISGVAVLGFHEDKIALLQIHRHAVGGEVWEIPRGFVEGSEPSAQAALRELTEETGLICEPQKLKPLGYVLPEAGVMSAKIAVFAAEDCRRGDGPLEETGLRAVHYVSWDQAVEMARRSEIQDPCTIVALFRYKSPPRS